jgi:hypothetical protein
MPQRLEAFDVQQINAHGRLLILRAHDCSEITSRATTLSRLARAIIAKGRVALIELLLDTGAVTPER